MRTRFALLRVLGLVVFLTAVAPSWADYQEIRSYSSINFPGYNATRYGFDPSFFGDVDGDCVVEVMGKSGSYLIIMDPMAHDPDVGLALNAEVDDIAVVDLNDDGTPEILARTRDNVLHVIDWVGGMGPCPVNWSDAPPSGSAPQKHSLWSPRPNPFNPSTTIPLELTAAGRVELDLYDVAGRKVRSLLNNAALEPGQHRVPWDGRDDAGRAVASGTYFYEMRVDGQPVAAKKAVLLK